MRYRHGGLSTYGLNGLDSETSTLPTPSPLLPTFTTQHITYTIIEDIKNN